MLIPIVRMAIPILTECVTRAIVVVGRTSRAQDMHKVCVSVVFWLSGTKFQRD